MVRKFTEISDIFLPLFEVTKDPSLNPKLHMFLQQIRYEISLKSHVLSGFDSVDDESKLETRKLSKEYLFNEISANFP